LACGWEKDLSTGGQITSLLRRWNAGDEEAFKSLVSLVYAELRPWRTIAWVRKIRN